MGGLSPGVRQRFMTVESKHLLLSGHARLARPKPGSQSHSLVSSIDIAPTILEIAGTSTMPKTFQGKSFFEYAGLNPSHENEGLHIRENIIGMIIKRTNAAYDLKNIFYLNNVFPELPHTPPADAVRSITYQKMRKLIRGREIDTGSGASHSSNPVQRRNCIEWMTDPYSFKNLAGDPKYQGYIE